MTGLAPSKRMTANSKASLTPLQPEKGGAGTRRHGDIYLTVIGLQRGVDWLPKRVRQVGRGVERKGGPVAGRPCQDYVILGQGGGERGRRLDVGASEQFQIEAQDRVRRGGLMDFHRQDIRAEQQVRAGNVGLIIDIGGVARQVGLGQRDIGNGAGGKVGAEKLAAIEPDDGAAGLGKAKIQLYTNIMIQLYLS